MAFESASAPVTAFMIAPLAEFWIIPWARSEQGRDALRPWLGDGDTRGLALVMVVAGLIMVVAAVAAFLTPAYRHISATYAASAPEPAGDQAGDSPSTGTDTDTDSDAASSVRSTSAEGV